MPRRRTTHGYTNESLVHYGTVLILFLDEKRGKRGSSMAAVASVKVWCHGSMLQQPTKVAVGSSAVDVDDLKELATEKIPVLKVLGTASFVVKRAVLGVVSCLYEPVGGELAVDMLLSDLGPLNDSHFFVEKAGEAPGARLEGVCVVCVCVCVCVCVA
jgi:hypothetical protein